MERTLQKFMTGEPGDDEGGVMGCVEAKSEGELFFMKLGMSSSVEGAFCSSL